MCCDFEKLYFLLSLVWFRVNQLVDSGIDAQAIKNPSVHLHPVVNRVSVDRIKRLHSRIFSLPSGLTIHSNTGVSRYFKCMQESSFDLILGIMLLFCQEVYTNLLRKKKCANFRHKRLFVLGFSNAMLSVLIQRQKAGVF